MADDFQDNDDEDDDGEGQNFTIDPELWLHVLLSYKGDEDEWMKLVNKVSKNAGLIPEKGELILNALLEYLLNVTRSN